MRILVVSDSHRHKYKLYRAIEAQPDAKHVIFLGDGEDDIDDAERRFPDRIFHKVRGNNDWCSDLPLVQTVTLDGYTLMYTHGHGHSVKYGLYRLISEAREKHADVLLYGHTHEPYTGYEDGLYIMNPGAICDDSCGIIDLTPSGVMCNTVKLRCR